MPPRATRRFFDRDAGLLDQASAEQPSHAEVDAATGYRAGAVRKVSVAFINPGSVN